MRIWIIAFLFLIVPAAYGQTNPTAAAYQRLPGETDQEYRARVDKIFASKVNESLGKLKALEDIPEKPQMQPHTARVLVYPGFVNGEKFLKFSEAERAMYTTGFLDAMLGSPLMGKDAEGIAVELHKCLAGKTNSQMAEIIRRYIDKDPARWNLGANVLGFEAIVAACK